MLGYTREKVVPKELFICWKHKRDIIVKEKQFTFNSESRRQKYELTAPIDMVQSQATQSLIHKRIRRRQVHSQS